MRLPWLTTLLDREPKGLFLDTRFRKAIQENSERLIERDQLDAMLAALPEVIPRHEVTIVDHSI